MAKCASCKKQGLFLRLNNLGLCDECEIRRLHLQNAWLQQQEEKQKRAAAELERKQRREEILQQKLSQAQNELNNIPCFTFSKSTTKIKRQTGYESIKTSNITPKGRYEEFVVFDTETTGLAPSKDRIIELAAIRFSHGVPTEKFETLVFPERNIPSEVTIINQIDDNMVKNAPLIWQILPSFENFIGNSALVAHNLEFDLKFLFYSGSQLADGTRKYYDTLEQARKLLRKPKSVYDREFGIWEVDYESDYDVENYKLDTLCRYYNITIPYQHRAAADALATGKLFLKLIAEKQQN